MSHLAIIALVGTIVMCPRSSAGHAFTGQVERVIDGDTIIVRALLPSLRCHCVDDGTSSNCASRCAVQLHRIRLAEIDAPELKEPGGLESKQALSDMILHRQVSITWTHRGRYRRIIGQVYVDGLSINRELVELGWAEVYRR